MRAEWYREVCRRIDQACPVRRRARQQFGDGLVLKVHFWSVGWRRPTCWACDAGNWLDEFRPGALPSQATMSRRLRTVGVRQALERLSLMLAERFPGGPVRAIDSRPLRVGSYSKDADARRGRAAGEMARGYKIHGVLTRASADGALWPWTLAPMNVNDQVPAAALLGRLGEVAGAGWGYVAGDNLLDANPVHLAAAAANRQLVAPPRRSNARVRDRRRNTPQRLRALDLTDRLLARRGVSTGFGLDLMRARVAIERSFGHQAMLGLGAPPPWVRRPSRVALWVGAMLVLQMLRKLEIKGVTA
jgi:hypothetical protein